ncbi:FAD:protein FMN transferase [Undibacterium terreum]|uniref:FAD:protein FMN transferase n=1 Tax=Undibacterium terreum TaxID=1224302 RepID=A0A916XQW6_9BURK|nr:FAD:protein FMN transferase [Undibacterium terreum]GGC96721.1 FAD:protein FMN transferase [Undibacterium terreum]
MEIYKIPFRAMACHCEVVIAMQSKDDAHAIAQKAIAEVQRIETKYSRYREDSIVSCINAAAGREAVTCDDETWSLLKYADSLYQVSDGLFDITSGVLRRVWNFKVPQIPAGQDLEQVLELIGWGGVRLEEQRIQLPKAGMEIDFGGFGKEYASDRAASLISHQGVQHGYVNLGGDIRVIGPKPDGQAWMMGIQDPRKKGALTATIPMLAGGLATSGDYERYFEVNGQRYCHVLNPRSGQPVSHWRSVSVLAPLAVVAGNCTTIAMLKETDGLAYLESTGMRYLAIDNEGRMHSDSHSESR